MSKILLVYDDFAELNATELSLKKATFDVIGLTNEYTIKDQIVSFNPDILVGFGSTSRVSSLSVGKKIKEMTRWTGKSILIFPKGHVLQADDLIKMRMDMLLETPVSVIRLIQIVCKLLKQDERAILEKLIKSFAKDRTDDLAFATYDSATVKAIQHIQGELENLDPSASVGFDKIFNTEADLNIKIDSDHAEPIEKGEDNKKSFFEKETASPAISGDPFASLISELKGESPSKPAANQVSSKTVKKTESTAVKSEAQAIKENPQSESAIFNPEALGQKIREEIESKAAQLAARVKKYTEMSADLHLYPESTVKKTKAKKALKRLKDEWDPTDLEAQDVDRKAFVERLFNKKKR